MPLISAETLAIARIIAALMMIVLVASAFGILFKLAYAYVVFQSSLAVLFILLMYLALKSWRVDQ